MSANDVINFWDQTISKWPIRPKKNIVCFRFATDPIKTGASRIYFMFPPPKKSNSDCNQSNSYAKEGDQKALKKNR